MEEVIDEIEKACKKLLWVYTKNVLKLQLLLWIAEYYSMFGSNYGLYIYSNYNSIFFFMGILLDYFYHECGPSAKFLFLLLLRQPVILSLIWTF